MRGLRPSRGRRAWRAAAVLLVAFLAACGTGGPVGAEASGPAEVLDGTEMVPFAALPDTGSPESLPGTYRSEQGGAEATLVIEQMPNGYRVTRSLAEPGAEPFVQSYHADERNGALRSQDGSMTVRGAPDGVVVHEAAAEDGIVPPDYWTRYYRSE
jgi:hypothetical protein